MFCSNCGSKIPDGSRFCSVCGTRLADVEPAGKEVISFAGNAKTEIGDNDSNANRAGRVSFDWSNVIEEPVKRTTPNVRSPWDEVQIEQRPRVDQPSVDHRRTMSFIEILKQEREEKLQAAEREAQALTQREEASPDYSAFNDAPSIYEPKVYEDMSKAAEEPVKESSLDQTDKAQSYEKPKFEEPKYEEPKNEEPKFEEPAFEEPKYEEYYSIENDFEEPLAEEPVVAEPVEFDAPSYKDDSEIFVPDVAEFKADEVKADYSVPVYGETATNVEDLYDIDSVIADADPSNLEAELDEILASSMGRVSRMERNAARDAEPEIELAAEYTAAPEVEPEAEIFDAAEPVAEYAAEPAVELEETTVFEPAIDSVAEYAAEPAAEMIETAVEEIQPEISLEEQIAADTQEPVNPMKSTIAPPAEDETEIAELKRRLADLMGAPEEPIDIAKEAPRVEEFVAERFEPTVEIAETEVAETPEIAIAAVDEAPSEPIAVDDAMSLEDLENDLFGEVAPESIEAEATKKIDKFYTLYKKNEEFQRLLDEEYNKLKEEDQTISDEPVVMPAVEKFEETTPVTVPTAEPVLVEKSETTPAVETIAPVAAEPIAEVTAPSKKDEKAAAKEAKKAAKAAAKQAKAEANNSDDDEEGGGALTVIAVIVAFLLVILLGVILVLNFAPDSGIAMTIDSLIENIASYFSATDAIKGVLL